MSTIGPAARVTIRVGHVVGGIEQLYFRGRGLARYAEKILQQTRHCMFALDESLPDRIPYNPYLGLCHPGSKRRPQRLTPKQYSFLCNAIEEAMSFARTQRIAEAKKFGKQHRRIRYWDRLIILLWQFIQRLDQEDLARKRALAKKRSEAQAGRQQQPDAHRELELRLAMSRALPVGLA